jgi:glutaredoxin 3
MTIIVWSQNGCIYCDQAKALLETKGMAYEERNINQDFTKQQLLEAVPSARTVPQIIIDGICIGGMIDLQLYLKEKNID